MLSPCTTCQYPALQPATMDAPSTQAPMTYVEQSTTGTTAWREWDDTPGCSLCKCCGDCACDCERGWCAPHVVMRAACKRSTGAEEGAADGAATHCVQGPVLPDHLVQLRHLCAPRAAPHLGRSPSQGCSLICCALTDSVHTVAIRTY